MMRTRDARYTDDGRIAATIDHPRLGWIPFVAGANDPDPFGRSLFRAFVEGKLSAVAPYDPTPPVQTPEEQIAAIVSALRERINETAKARNYDDAITCATYVASTNAQWAAEATAFVAWRDLIWETAFTEFARYQAGEREIPTIAEALAQVPPIVWPV